MASTPLRLFCLLLAAHFAVAQSEPTCYFPDGHTEAPNDVPCNVSATASPCCNKNNICLDDGLCLLNGIMSRGSCTDKSWGPGCADFCTGNDAGGISLFPCSPWGNIFSCEWGNCSSQFSIQGGNAIILRANQVSTLGTSAAALVSATDVLQVVSSNSTSNVSTSSESSDAATSQSCDAKYTAGEMAGVGAGVGIPLLLALIGALILLVREQKSNRKQKYPQLAYEPVVQHSQSHYINNGPSTAYKSPMVTTGNEGMAYKAESNGPVLNEMAGTRERQELPAQYTR